MQRLRGREESGSSEELKEEYQSWGMGKGQRDGRRHCQMSECTGKLVRGLKGSGARSGLYRCSIRKEWFRNQLRSQWSMLDTRCWWPGLNHWPQEMKQTGQILNIYWKEKKVPQWWLGLEWGDRRENQGWYRLHSLRIRSSETFNLNIVVCDASGATKQRTGCCFLELRRGLS